MLRINDIIEGIKTYNPRADITLLQKAYVYSAKILRGRTGSDDSPYMLHPLETAGLLTQLRLDAPGVAAGLLHDAVSSAQASIEDIEENFGPELAGILDKTLRIGRIRYRSAKAGQVEAISRMILATARDLRVLMICLADRLQTIRASERLGLDDTRRYAEEIMAIYAPFAGRLGVQWLKDEMEDECFRRLEPDLYEEIESRLKRFEKKEGSYFRQVQGEIEALLAKTGLRGRVHGRLKHIYSIHCKMVEKNLAFEEVHDKIAFRVVVRTIRECYETLRAIHASFRPIPGYLDDYIAHPKSNMYQSLHTAVTGPRGRTMEVQIRTEDMHEVAENGVAAHWKYKDGKGPGGSAEQVLARLPNSVEWTGAGPGGGRFSSAINLGLIAEEVFVLTPGGDVVELPAGSTPVDFAFAIHTGVGYGCRRARVNGKFAPLDYLLESGDRVEIITGRRDGPSPKWLAFVKSSKARSMIEHFLEKKNDRESRPPGLALLEKELRKKGGDPEGFLNRQTFLFLAEEFGLPNADALFAALAKGEIDVREAAEKALASGRQPPDGAGEVDAASRADGKKREIRLPGNGNRPYRLARCCAPLPGEPVVGLPGGGGGGGAFTIHRVKRRYIVQSDPAKRVKAEWTPGAAAPRRVRLELISDDRPGMIADIARTVTDRRSDIRHIEARATDEKMGYCKLDLLVRDVGHLENLLAALKDIDGMLLARRVRCYS